MPSSVPSLFEGLRAIGKDMVNCWRVSLAQVESILSLQFFRLGGVGSVSVPANRKEESCPAGRPSTIHLQTWFLPSS